MEGRPPGTEPFRRRGDSRLNLGGKVTHLPDGQHLAVDRPDRCHRNGTREGGDDERQSRDDNGPTPDHAGPTSPDDQATGREDHGQRLPGSRPRLRYPARAAHHRAG